MWLHFSANSACVGAQQLRLRVRGFSQTALSKDAIPQKLASEAQRVKNHPAESIAGLCKATFWPMGRFSCTGLDVASTMVTSTAPSRAIHHSARTQKVVAKRSLPRIVRSQSVGISSNNHALVKSKSPIFSSVSSSPKRQLTGIDGAATCKAAHVSTRATP